MNWLEFAALALTGFVACAEFGSYAFVHPVIKRLPPREHLQVEQGLLKTFGRVMPVGMTAAPTLALLQATRSGETTWAGWAAVVALFVALATTIAVNVGINLRTGTWDIDHPPEDWRRARTRWEFFQGVRSWLLLAGFVALSAQATGVAG